MRPDAIARCAALLLAMSVVGMARAEDSVLRGEAAFGDWRADRPGVRRLLKADDQPQPFVTKSVSNGPDKARMPHGARPLLPPGFTAELIASGIAGPRTVRVAPNGDLFVADSKVNQIRVYRLQKGSARPVRRTVFATGLYQPYGIAFYPAGDNPEWVYVANSDSIVRFPYTSGDLKASGEPETIVDHIPSTHHWTRDIV